MKSQVIKTIGHSSATVFYNISNGFNLNSLIPLQKMDKRKLNSDLSALEQDWKLVGQGVSSAIERFEKQVSK